MPILTIARFTLIEASRRRLLLTVAILTVAMVAFTGWGFSRVATLSCDGQPCPDQEIKFASAFLVILVIYMFNIVLAMSSVFVAAPAIAGEIESGLALAILPRPIRRSEVILGKWLGLGLLVTAYAAATAALEFAVVDLITGYLPPHPVEAILYLIGEALILLTLAILISTRLASMAGGVISIVVFGMAWIAGVSEAIGLAFQNVTMTNVGVAMSLILPTDALWRGAIFSLEPNALLTVGGTARRAASINPFFVVAPPPTAHLVWAAGWVIVVLGLAVFSFNRRDL